MHWKLSKYTYLEYNCEFDVKPVLLLQDGTLALSSSLHSEVALLVAEAYQKYLTDKPYSGLISEGIKQVAHPLTHVQ